VVFLVFYENFWVVTLRVRENKRANQVSALVEGQETHEAFLTLGHEAR
jgi:hypothetical protein